MVAKYPNSVATDADLYVAVNNLATALVGALLISGDNTGGLGIAVVSTFNFPTSGFITIDDEAISYTGISANKFTGITRAADGTVAATHANTASVGLDWLAAHHNAPKDEIEAIESDLINLRKSCLPNILVNGGFENWQRNTSFTNPISTSFVSDAWKVLHGGVTPPSFVIAAEPTAVNLYRGLYALRLTCTFAGLTLSDGLKVQQSIEDIYNWRGQTLSLSVQIKTTLVNKVRIQIEDDAGNTLSSFHTGSGTYEKLSVTRAISSTATFLKITVGMIFPADVAVGVFYADSVMLIPGTTSFDYQPENPSTSLLRCLRFYEKQSGIFWRFYDSIGATQYSLPVHFSLPKASVPTVTLANGTFFHVASTAPGSVNTNGFLFLINTNAAVGDTYIGGISDASWSAATT
jgi:hypothetical protein